MLGILALPGGATIVDFNGLRVNKSECEEDKGTDCEAGDSDTGW